MTCAIKKLSLFTSQHHAAIQFPYLIGNFRILAIHRGIAYNISRRLCSRAIYQKGKHRSIKNAHHDRSRADLGSYIYIYVGIFPNPPKRRFRVKAIVLIRAYGRRRRHARARVICILIRRTYTRVLYDRRHALPFTSRFGELYMCPSIYVTRCGYTRNKFVDMRTESCSAGDTRE